MKYFPLVFVLLLCASCSSVSATGPAPLGTPQLVTSAPTLTATENWTPTETPLPTVDHQGTIVAETHLQSTATLQREQTVDAGTELAATRTQSAFDLALTSDESNRAAGAVSQNKQMTMVAEQGTQQADKDAMDKVRPTIIVALTQATYTDAHEITNIAVSWVAVLVALVVVAVCIVWCVVKLRTPVDYNYALGDPAQPLPDLERPVNQTAPGVYDLDTVPPGDPAKFSKFAEYALTDAPLGINAVEGTKIYTRTEYAPVYAWLAKKQHLAPNNGAVGLSDAGKQFCKTWCDGHQKV